MKGFLRNNFYILLSYFVLLAIALYFILNFDKNGVHIYLNHFVGVRVFDAFFYYITYFGDGRFAAVFLVLILVYNARLGIYSVCSFLSATLFSIALKYLFFDDANRPFFIFSYIHKYQLRLVDGIDVHIHNSFPSGHATQAFGILMCLVLTQKSVSLKWLFFVLALLTSISRVYLSQHWLVDITAGSAIGTFFSLLYYYLFIHRDKLQKWNKPALDLKKP